jgi:hypothetical protein
LLAVGGFIKVPAFMQPEQQALAAQTKSADGMVNSSSEVAVGGSVRRIGRAETAPLLRFCVPFSKLGFDSTDRVPPGELYRALKSASRISRLTAMVKGKNGRFNEESFTIVWADVADCVYKQNGWALCDQDNRALAVEAAATLLGQLQIEEKEPVTEKVESTRSGLRRKEERLYAIRNAHAIKDRVLSSVRSRVAEGRLIASDFGLFAPIEIVQIVRDTKVTGTGCANST